RTPAPPGPRRAAGPPPPRFPAGVRRRRAPRPGARREPGDCGGAPLPPGLRARCRSQRLRQPPRPPRRERRRGRWPQAQRRRFDGRRRGPVDRGAWGEPCQRRGQHCRRRWSRRRCCLPGVHRL
ncbi:MAG: hypothetical protein ACK55I_32210, partial [bacterium]